MNRVISLGLFTAIFFVESTRLFFDIATGVWDVEKKK